MVLAVDIKKTLNYVKTLKNCVFEGTSASQIDFPSTPIALLWTYGH